MIVLVGFLLAPVVLWLGLRIYPDLTTFFLYGLVPGGLLFGGLAYAVSNLGLSLPVGALAGGLAGLGLLASLGLYRRRQNEACARWADPQLAFEAQERQETAEWAVKHIRDFPHDKAGRRWSWQQTPAQWRPSPAELLQAVDKYTGTQPREFTRDCNTGFIAFYDPNTRKHYTWDPEEQEYKAA